MIIILLFVVSIGLIMAGYVLLLRKSSPAGSGLMLCAFMVLTIAFSLLHSGEGSSINNFRPLRIAHAGGAVEGATYTNSFDALELNILKGFKYFELDFNFTSDGQLVCIHDWETNFERAFGFKAAGVPTLKEFERLVKRSKFDNCTLDRLVPWLAAHPAAIIVTDVKGDNLSALRVIADKVPGFGKKVIPQIYLPQNYDVVKAMGYEQVIWTLYRSGAPGKDVLKRVRTFKGSFAITMPVNRAITTLPKELALMDIPTYVHTINKKEDAAALMNRFGVTEIYTDRLYPEAD